MANPSGRNSTNSFDQFTEGSPYGAKKQEAALAASAPIAGAEPTGSVLNTAREAADIAKKGPVGRPRKAAQAPQQTGPLDDPPVSAPPNPTADLWQAVASTPGASPLVQSYAERAAQAAPVQTGVLVGGQR